MAAALLAMNELYGAIFEVSLAEAATPAMAQERADALKDQSVKDIHTHFPRDDTRNTNFLEMRRGIEKLAWNKELTGRQTVEDLKFANYIKEIFLDSDTKIALISSAPSDIPRNWLLTDEQLAAARERINDRAQPARWSAQAAPVARGVHT
jgi:uncharacterized protein